MKKIYFLFNILLLMALMLITGAHAQVRGIYITQPTLEDSQKIQYLIKRAKAADINTFVIDYEAPSKRYTKNIELVKNSGLRYVARITVFPGGATPAQLHSIPYREKKMKLIQQAVGLGAQEIQLDYIRYNSQNRPSDQNVQDVKQVIQWFRDRVAAYKIPLQIDVFGITAFHHERRIGQYPKVFAGSVDGINPMVYPSHFAEYRDTSAHPYRTVYNSLSSLKEQLKDQKPVRIIAYIEAYNYRYPIASSQRENYVKAQMRAAEDSNIAGWYFWSANNRYDHVFNMLKTTSIAKTQPSTNIVNTNSKPLQSSAAHNTTYTPTAPKSSSI